MKGKRRRRRNCVKRKRGSCVEKSRRRIKEGEAV